MRANIKSEQELTLSKTNSTVRTTMTNVPEVLQNEFNKYATSIGFTKKELYLIGSMTVIKKLGGTIPEFRGKHTLIRRWKNANKR